MKNESLENYIIQKNKYNPFVMDCIKFELQKKLYYYGDHFKNPSENNKKIPYKVQIKDIIKNILIKNKKINIIENSVISEAYFSFSSKLKELNFNIYKTPWAWHSISEDTKQNIYNKAFFNKVISIEKYINNIDFNCMLEEEFTSKVYDILDSFTSLYKHKNVKALFLAQDMNFFQKIIIKAFKENNKKSFIFLHGLPARYNNIDDNRTDYLLVWGDKIKENYINKGVDKNKIFSVGHPLYQKYERKNLRFSLDNILVITKSLPGAPISSDEELLFQDRSRILLYLYSIQNTLSKFGVNNVRLRVHPSENINWYMKYVDKKFYTPDYNNLKESIEKSTLLIGPMSTLLLESIYYGVNYLLYEPNYEGYSLLNEKIVEPFDGSDKNIPVAKNEDELYEILKERVLVNPDCFHDYIKTPFDIKFIKDLI